MANVETSEAGTEAFEAKVRAALAAVSDGFDFGVPVVPEVESYGRASERRVNVRVRADADEAAIRRCVHVALCAARAYLREVEASALHGTTVGLHEPLVPGFHRVWVVARFSVLL